MSSFSLTKNARTFYCNADGTVAVFWAIVLPIVVGGIALSTDIGTWYLGKRNLQNTTDAAAIAAAYDISGIPQQAVMWYTANNEFTRNGLSNVTLTVNYPPDSGAYAGDELAVEVIALQPQTNYFSKVLIDGDTTDVRARAVALRQSQGSACVLALESLQDDSLLFQGNATINLNECMAAANSTDGEAIGISGSSTLNAESIYTAGGYDINGGATLNTDTPPITNAQPIADPYDHLEIPSYSGCDENNLSINNTRTLNPGVYCNGVTLNANAVVTLNPGTYIFDRETFRVNGGAQLTGDNVTIILTSSTGDNHADVRINGGANVTLTASTGGDYEGMLFYQDEEAPQGNTNYFNGGSTTNFTGALYFPNQELQFTGNNSNGSGACTKLVARIVTFTGSSNISNSCPASVDDIIVPGVVQLVE